MLASLWKYLLLSDRCVSLLDSDGAEGCFSGGTEIPEDPYKIYPNTIADSSTVWWYTWCSVWLGRGGGYGLLDWGGVSVGSSVRELCSVESIIDQVSTGMLYEGCWDLEGTFRLFGS